MSPQVLQRPDTCVLGVCENPRKGMQPHDLHEVPLLRGVKDNLIFAAKPQHRQEWECIPVWEHSSVMRLSQVCTINCSVQNAELRCRIRDDQKKRDVAQKFPAGKSPTGN